MESGRSYRLSLRKKRSLPSHPCSLYTPFSCAETFTDSATKSKPFSTFSAATVFSSSPSLDTSCKTTFSDTSKEKLTSATNCNKGLVSLCSTVQGDMDAMDFKLNPNGVVCSDKNYLPAIEEEEIQLVKALSASTEQEYDECALFVGNKRKRKKAQFSSSLPMLLTTTSDEAQCLLEKRTDQMIMDQLTHENDEISCTPAFMESFAPCNPAIEVVSVCGKEVDRSDELCAEKRVDEDGIAGSKPLWELSWCSEQKEDFYVPELSGIVKRSLPSPERFLTPPALVLPTDREAHVGALKDLSSALLSLVDSSSTSDLTLITKGGSLIHAHSVILKCRCPRMREVLESNPKMLDLSAFSHSSVMALLVFLYSAIVPVGGEEEVITLAEIWGLEDLVKICTERMKEQDERMETNKIHYEMSTPIDCDADIPNHQKMVLESEYDVTPMPNYRAMATPHLKMKCSGFGVRALRKKKMIAKLEEIYSYTHPFVDDHGHILTTTEESRKVVDENQPQKATKNSVNEAEIVAVIEAITKDTQVYNDILLYKPLELSDVLLKLKSAAVVISKDKLKNVLDYLCVTVSTPGEKPVAAPSQ